MSAGAPQLVPVWRRSRVHHCCLSEWRGRSLYWPGTCTSIRYHTHIHTQLSEPLQALPADPPPPESLCVQDSELDYECVLVIEGQTVVVDAYVETDDMNPSNFDITCQLHQV